MSVVEFGNGWLVFARQQNVVVNVLDIPGRTVDTPDAKGSTDSPLGEIGIPNRHPYQPRAINAPGHSQTSSSAHLAVVDDPATAPDREADGLADVR